MNCQGEWLIDGKPRIKVRDASNVESAVPGFVALAEAITIVAARKWTDPKGISMPHKYDPQHPRRLALRQRAWNEIRRCLASGRLRSFIQTDVPELVETPCSAWAQSSPAPPALSRFYIELVREQAAITGWVVLRAADVENLVFSRLEHSPVQSGARRGRPAVHKWEECLMEAARYVFDEGRPKTQSQLAKHLSDWFENHGRPSAAPRRGAHALLDRGLRRGRVSALRGSDEWQRKLRRRPLSSRHHQGRRSRPGG